MDYQEYQNILRYINNNDIEGLKNYIEIEKELHYLNNAKKEFVKYMAYINSEYGMIKDQLLITNGYSVYLLNNDELLSRYYKKKIKEFEDIEYQKRLIKTYKAYLHYLKLVSSDVKSVKKHNYKVYAIKSSEATYYFDKELYDESKIFLGGDIKYKLANEMAALQVESSKGKGVILGIRRSK